MSSQDKLIKSKQSPSHPGPTQHAHPFLPSFLPSGAPVLTTESSLPLPEQIPHRAGFFCLKCLHHSSFGESWVRLLGSLLRPPLLGPFLPQGQLMTTSLAPTIANLHLALTTKQALCLGIHVLCLTEASWPHPWAKGGFR